jgi:thiamine-phosphate pyrophosphorylase
MTRPHRAELLRGVYVIVNEDSRALELARAVLDGGCGILQYRAKSGVVPERLRELRALTRERGALLIVDDDWRAACAFDCDGVHLGPDDDGFQCVAPVRAAMPDRLIGLSCGTAEEVRTANRSGADYLGVGSVYATASKADAGNPIGVEGLRMLVDESAVPVAAIGGVSLARIGAVRRAGAAMAAVISAVAGAPNPRRAVRELIDAWNCGTWD